MASSDSPASWLVAPLTELPVAAEDLLAPIARAVRCEARVAPLRVDLAAAWDPGRRQYDSGRVLQELLARRPPGASRLVGVIDVDLFVLVLTFVYGEAQLGGSVAVASCYRFREPAPGWAGTGSSLTRRRLTQTVLHELGHTVGLRHCPDPSCVMASAACLEMLDAKGESFCLDCREGIARPAGRVTSGRVARRWPREAPAAPPRSGRAPARPEGR